MTEPTVKLQAVMARAGYGSRRACEQIIREGRVRVNGERAQLGLRIEPGADDVQVDGLPLRPEEEITYYVLHKPPGVLSSLESQGGWPTVIDLVRPTVRVYPVGRLDLDSEGLVLLTNDGELAQLLTHPRFQHEKEYRVLLDRMPNEDQVRKWRAGVELPDGGKTLPAAVIREPGTRWLKVVLREGRKRQIRLTARALGLHVERLIRVRLANLELGDLNSGDWRELTKSEIMNLLSEVKGRPWTSQ